VHSPRVITTNRRAEPGTSKGELLEMKTQTVSPHPVYLKAAKGEWIGHADIAKLIRSAVARAFHGTKFSVITKTYSGGGSISLRWENGPTIAQVDKVVQVYQTRHFDGMIDLAHDSDLWLYPDGSAHVAHDHGTEGSMGTHAEVIESARHPEAVLVSNITGAYVFTNRDVCAKAFHAAIAQLRSENWGCLSGFDWSLITVEETQWGAHTKGCPCVQVGGPRMWLDSEISWRAHQIAYPETLPDPALCW
jgi:hypothetical protein